MCLKSPGTDVGAASFERCPRTFETHFTLKMVSTLRARVAIQLAKKTVRWPFRCKIQLGDGLGRDLGSLK